MEVSRQTTINVPASELWRILHDDFDKISHWAAPIKSSSPDPEVAVGDGRICDTTFGKNTEVITSRDKGNHTFTYEVTPEKVPFFLKGISNTWQINPIGDNQSEVSTTSEIVLSSSLETVAGSLMKKQMHKAFGEILEDLKHYAETGEVR